jgi:hypothetical protein
MAFQNIKLTKMSTLTKGMGHESHMILLVGFLSKMTILTKF